MNSLIKAILVLTISLHVYKAECQNNKKISDHTFKSIDTFLEKTMKELKIVGFGAAIIINKEMVWAKGYGYADKEKEVPFTSGTIMNIGSIAKTFTGVCLMKAIEEKKLSLDEDINHFLPFKVTNPFFPNEKITLRNIATHTSGLADRYPFYDSTYYYGSDSPELLGEFLKNYFDPNGRYYSKKNFLNHKPGTYREYSNIGAGLAGYIVELRTGKKLNEYSRQYIFDPLKMNNSGWFLSEINLTNHSKLYEKQEDTIKQIQLYGTTTYPDGGVRTSINDLSKFFICLLNDGEYNGKRILKKETVKEMLRFQFTELNKPENVDPEKLNSGIFWATKMGGKRIGHNGSDPGVRTFMLSDLNKEIAVILFSNTSLLEKEEGKFFDIYSQLYKYGEGFKSKK